MNWRYVKANIEVTDCRKCKRTDGETLTYSVKLSNADWIRCEVDLTTGGTATRGDDYN